MGFGAKSVFEVAYWFADKALDSNEYLQPQKLQYLLYLSQGYFAVVHDGAKLMPGTFVAEDSGPNEPSIHVAFSKGRPTFEVDMFMDTDAQQVVDSIWRRFGHHSADHLAKLCKQTHAYQMAFKRGRGTEIPLATIQKTFERATDSPSVDQVVRPRWARSATGKPVAVKAWNPSQLKK